MSSIYLKTLQIDKRYLAKEPDQTDIVYVAKMILIYAAAEQIPRILEEAPSFFGKHLNYLKDKFPNYFVHAKDSQPEAVAATAEKRPSDENPVKRAQMQMSNTIQRLLKQDGAGGIDKLLILTRNSFRQLMRAL